MSWWRRLLALFRPRPETADDREVRALNARYRGRAWVRDLTPEEIAEWDREREEERAAARGEGAYWNRRHARRW